MTVTSPLQQVLLAALLVADGSVVSADRLVDLLWERGAPADPRQALQTHVSRLRGRLAAAGADAERLLVTRSPGYRLDVADEQVDARRFERLAAVARDTDDPARVLAAVDEALALWRGPVLSGFDHDFARDEASRLDQVRLGVVDLRAAALLRSGRAGEAVEGLAPVVAEHPLHEDLHGRLMVALYRSGRQAEALAVYQQLRQRLGDELGLDPSAELRDLERDILQQRPHLGAPADDPPADGRGAVTPRDRAGDPPASGTGSRPVGADRSLPVETTSFVGREAEFAAVVAAVGESRLVTVTGVGGVGKTRLAIRVAAEIAGDHRDGVWVCDLAGVPEPDQVAAAIATSLGVHPRSGVRVADAVVAHLRHLRSLVVLDNCEHVIDGVAAIVAEILRQCGGVHVLATSRQPIAVAGEQVWPLAPLAVRSNGDNGPAVRLFLDRAGAVDAGLDPSELADDPAVVDLCERLDGLPLAIELAAARVRSMTPADIVVRLDRRLELLGSPRRSVPGRHRTLRRVVEWSHQLLSTPAQQLFARLSVFAGGFTLAAAEAVCADDVVPAAELAVHLADLVDHSMVMVDRSGPTTRYRLLETLRLFGRDQLGDQGQWRRRHARYFLELAEAAGADLHGDAVALAVETLSTEFANLRAAHQWALTAGETDLALSLPCLLHRYASYRLVDEVFRWVEAALSAAGTTERATHPLALAVAAAGCAHRGDLDRASELAYEARRRAGPEDVDVGLRVLFVLCEVAIFRRRLPELAEWSGQLVDRAVRAGQHYDEAFGHLFAGFGAMFAGQAAETLAHLERGRAVAERLDNADLQASLTLLSGQVRLGDDPGHAESLLQESIDQAQGVDNRFLVAIARLTMASLQARHGDTGRALHVMREVIQQWRRGGLWTHLWATLRDLLVLLARMGEHESAVVLHGAIETAAADEVAFGVETERRDRVLVELRSAMDNRSFEAAKARGLMMDEDEAVAWILATIDDLAAQPVSP